MLQTRTVRTLKLKDSGSETANGNGTGKNASNVIECLVFLDITAVSGTSPTLDVKIDSKDPVSGNFVEIAAFAQQTATGTVVLKITGTLGEEIRARWVIGGTTPDFTFSVTGSGKS